MNENDNRNTAQVRWAIVPRLSKNSRRIVTSATVCAIALCGLASRAQDQPVDPLTEKQETSKDDQGNDSKDETKKKDDLSERLIRKALSESDEDLMAEILRLMNETAQRLEQDFDPGEDTQALQTRIMDRLDAAIKQAASQARRTSTPSPGKPGDKRKMSQGPKMQGGKSGGDEQGSEGGDDSTVAPERGAPIEADTSGGAIEELRRAWGNLPDRERDEVIQGQGEAFLEKYRKLIEQYYRSLQSAEDSP